MVYQNLATRFADYLLLYSNENTRVEWEFDISPKSKRRRLFLSATKMTFMFKSEQHTIV